MSFSFFSFWRVRGFTGQRLKTKKSRRHRGRSLLANVGVGGKIYPQYQVCVRTWEIRLEKWKLGQMSNLDVIWYVIDNVVCGFMRTRITIKAGL